MKDTKQLNQMAAQLIVTKDSVWQLANVVRDCKSRFETISVTHPEIFLKDEINRCLKSLERHAPDVLRYSPHPFGWKLDDVERFPSK
jgi:hypothetical protein